MPKKKPITKHSKMYLTKVVHDGFSSLLIVRSILAGHLRRDERLMRRIGRFVDDYGDFERECEGEFLKRAGEKLG